MRFTLEKAPLFALSMASCVVTVAAQSVAGSLSPVSSLSIEHRLFNAVNAYVAYLGKMLWPTRLCAYYPLPLGSPPIWQTVTALGALCCITALVLWFSRRAPYLSTGWFWYLGTLVPVIGIVQVGTQGLADRYTYVPLVGVFLLGVWGTADLGRRLGGAGRIVLAILASVTLGACCVLTWRQVRTWHDSIALWQHALDVVPDNYQAEAYLAQEWLERGEVDEARRLSESSLKHRPNAFAHLVLGTLDLRDRRSDDAKGHFEQALSLESVAWGEASNGLGVVLANGGDIAGAESQFRRALDDNPYSATAHNNLGLLLMRQGRFEEATRWFKGATQLDSSFAAAYENLGTAHALVENWTDALAACATAVDLQTREPRFRRLLGYLLWELKDLKEARTQYKIADRLDPNWRKRTVEEVRELLQRSYSGPYSPRIAVLLSKQICEAGDPAPPAADLDLLARAYAASNQPGKARATAQKALRAAEASGHADLAADIRARLAAFGSTSRE